MLSILFWAESGLRILKRVERDASSTEYGLGSASSLAIRVLLRRGIPKQGSGRSRWRGNFERFTFMCIDDNHTYAYL